MTDSTDQLEALEAIRRRQARLAHYAETTGWTQAPKTPPDLPMPKLARPEEIELELRARADAQLDVENLGSELEHYQRVCTHHDVRAIVDGEYDLESYLHSASNAYDGDPSYGLQSTSRLRRPVAEATELREAMSTFVALVRLAEAIQPARTGATLT